MENVTDRARFEVAERLGSKFQVLIDGEESQYQSRKKEDQEIYHKHGISEPLALGGAVVLGTVGGIVGGYLANEWIRGLFR